VPEPTKFKFRKNDRVGDPSAEQDPYLAGCFIDTGNLAILRDCADPRTVVVGRTGSGKSALLYALREQCEHCIEVDLQALALNYVTGSTLLTFFERELRVNLDRFYQFLWRHVFVVEILKQHYRIEDEADRKNWFERVTSQFVRNKGRIEAFRYLNSWGTKFWTTSEERIHEITTYIERELSGKAGLDVGQVAALQAGGKLTLSEQQVREISRRGEEIVNGVQMSTLSALMDSLDEDILTDPKRRYYIVVDFLDEQWLADERLRVWMLRGLIETVRDFNRKVRHAKIVVALRLDLLRRVYRATSDSGFQEEKYEALNLDLTWTRDELEQLLDERVQALVRRTYTKQPVRLRDILPAKMSGRAGGESGIAYLLDRTLMRPRDAIQFLNACLEVAVGDPRISADALRAAEAKYSQQRRTALADEWSMIYPYLVLLTDLLKGRGPQFRLGEIADSDLDGVCLRLREAEEDHPRPHARDVEMFDRYYRSAINGADLRSLLAQCFYTVGLIGVKLSPQLGTLWSSDGGPAALNSAEISDDVTVNIHKAFWRVLGINPEASNTR
jgi:DNA-binding transcriptional ArsR family regulator